MRLDNDFIRIPLVLCATVLLAVGVCTAQQLTVETDAATYYMGQTVQVTIHNPTANNVDITSSPYFAIVHDGAGGCRYGCLGLPVMTIVTPGETIVIGYDTGMNPDPAGQYLISVHEFLAGTFPPGDPPTTTYTLLDPTANEDKVWSSLKTLYR